LCRRGAAMARLGVADHGGRRSEAVLCGPSPLLCDLAGLLGAEPLYRHAARAGTCVDMKFAV
jgi:hypothetical protein